MELKMSKEELEQQEILRKEWAEIPEDPRLMLILDRNKLEEEKECQRLH